MRNGTHASLAKITTAWGFPPTPIGRKYGPIPLYQGFCDSTARYCPQDGSGAANSPADCPASRLSPSKWVEVHCNSPVRSDPRGRGRCGTSRSVARRVRCSQVPHHQRQVRMSADWLDVVSLKRGRVWPSSTGVPLRFIVNCLAADPARCVRLLAALTELILEHAPCAAA